MYKFLVILCVIGNLLGLAGTASAIFYQDIKDLDVTLAEGTIAGIFYPSSYSYYHATPADFEVPPDLVTSASLTISGYWIDGNDDQVEVEETAVATLEEGGSQGGIWIWNWDFPSVTIFSLAASIFDPWENTDVLDVTISANGSSGDGILRLASSTLNLNYENGGSIDPAVPVSEPATMLLLGSGLIGLASFGRKKIFTRASA